MKPTPAFILALAILLFPFSNGYADDWWSKARSLLESAEEQGLMDSGNGGITLDEMRDAFRQALRIGSAHVVEQLGSVDGFNADDVVRILLPEELDTVKSALYKVGMDDYVDDLEIRLNRAAEVATPKAKAIFFRAIEEMTFDDVKKIYEGEDDAATKYFRNNMTPSLKQEMRPVINASLSEVGAIKAWDKVIGKYQSLPFVPDVKADLTEHVLDEGLEGIFHYLAKEEAAIRQDPVRQTTDLLKKVFGNN
jgi:hypothetical protein